MKSLILIAVSVFAVSAFAQKNKVSTSSSSSSATTSMSSYSDAELTGTLGFVNSAPNLGVQYNKLSSSNLGVGGYFFLQTDKENNNSKVVYQTLSFGGQMKAHLVRASGYEAYLTPGFGLHMLKDYPDSSASGKSDLTGIGPTLRIGVLRAISPTMKIGLERLELWNWLEVKGPANGVSYSLAFSMDM
jgi:hypothetical protein